MVTDEISPHFRGAPLHAIPSKILSGLNLLHPGAFIATLVQSKGLYIFNSNI